MHHFRKGMHVKYSSASGIAKGEIKPCRRHRGWAGTYQMDQ